MSARPKARVAAGACPECGKPADPAHRPFCSDRCRRVDLNRWLSGGYAIPGEPADPDDLPPREE